MVCSDNGIRTTRLTEVLLNCCCGLEVFSRECPWIEVEAAAAGWRSGGMPDEWRRWFRYCMILIMFSTRAPSASAFGSS